MIINLSGSTEKVREEELKFKVSLGYIAFLTHHLNSMKSECLGSNLASAVHWYMAQGKPALVRGRTGVQQDKRLDKGHRSLFLTIGLGLQRRSLGLGIHGTLDRL
jgi:hypothetical protein